MLKKKMPHIIDNDVTYILLNRCVSVNKFGM